MMWRAVDEEAPTLADADPPPRDIKSLRGAIVARHASLPKRLIQVAEFTLRHPEEIAFGTLAEIAAQAQVQPSTLVRFAQAFGYSGFSELQTVFRAHARERWPDYRDRLQTLNKSDVPPGDAASLLAGFGQAAALSLDRLREGIDAEALDRAVALLAAAQTIYLLGSRRSFPLTAFLTYALRKLAMRCELVDQIGGLAAEQVALIQPTDALLAVSFTPYSPVTLELSAAAGKAGVPVVAITDTPFSPLVQTATVWLEVAEADHAGFRSLAGGFVLGITLAVAAAGRRGGSSEL
jgi:DNA-binding MurR/RpiR family transcriptional regulator